VRDNQRKSRARKQQYIQELEQKVAVCNAQAQQRDIEHRIALQNLELENGKLRGLLTRLGYDGGSLDEYLRGESNPVTSEKIAIPVLKKEPPRTESPTVHKHITSRSPMNQAPPPKRCVQIASVSVSAASSTFGPPESSASKPSTPVTTCVPATGCCGPVETALSKRPEDHLNPLLERTVELEASTTPPDTSVKLPPIASICDCGPAWRNAWPENESAVNTTLCGIAEDLIHQYNIRGVDVNAIKQKLWPGFRKGTTDGCRVQNHVLFEVLDEISGSTS
jgi:hypothetical protein